MILTFEIELDYEEADPEAEPGGAMGDVIDEGTPTPTELDIEDAIRTGLRHLRGMPEPRSVTARRQ